jgi:hypothetical protein
VASVSLAIAAQTARRAYATIAVIAWFLVLSAIVGVLVAEIGGGGRLSAFLGPFAFLQGSTMFIFDIEPGRGGFYDEAGFGMWAYFVAVLVYIALGSALVLRRFQRIAA